MKKNFIVFTSTCNWRKVSSLDPVATSVIPRLTIPAFFPEWWPSLTSPLWVLTTTSTARPLILTQREWFQSYYKDSWRWLLSLSMILLPPLMSCWFKETKIQVAWQVVLLADWEKGMWVRLLGGWTAGSRSHWTIVARVDWWSQVRAWVLGQWGLSKDLERAWGHLHLTQMARSSPLLREAGTSYNRAGLKNIYLGGVVCPAPIF